MKKYFFILISLYLSFPSCIKHDESKSLVLFNPVIVNDLQINGDIIEADTLLLKINSLTDRKEFIYYDLSRINRAAKDTFCDHYTIFKNFDSIILYNRDTCKLTSCKDLIVNGKIYKICKYFFDHPEVYDDALEFFVNDSLGLLQVYALNWNKYARFDTDSMRILMNNLLLKDTSNFVRRQDNLKEYYEELEKRIVFN